jgi:hypothetical protein
MSADPDRATSRLLEDRHIIPVTRIQQIHQTPPIVAIDSIPITPKQVCRPAPEVEEPLHIQHSIHIKSQIFKTQHLYSISPPISTRHNSRRNHSSSHILQPLNRPNRQVKFNNHTTPTCITNNL